MFLEQMDSTNVSESVKSMDLEEYVDLDEELNSYGNDDELVRSVVNDVYGGKASESNVSNNASTSLGISMGGSFPFIGEMNAGMLFAIPIASLLITVLLFTLVVEKKKAPKNGFMRWLREFLNFRSILISGIIKFVYLFSATVLTIFSFVVMAQGKDDTMLEAILAGLAILIFGNVSLRIVMELIMILIGLWKNTSDMRAVMVRDDEKPNEKKPKAPRKSKEFKESAENEMPDLEELQPSDVSADSPRIKTHGAPVDDAASVVQVQMPDENVQMQASEESVQISMPDGDAAYEQVSVEDTQVQNEAVAPVEAQVASGVQEVAPGVQEVAPGVQEMGAPLDGAGGSNAEAADPVQGQFGVFEA